MTMAQELLSDRKLDHREGYSTPDVAEERIEEVREIFAADPLFSIPRASTAPGISPATLHQILPKYLRLFPSRLQNLHFLRLADKCPFVEINPKGYS